MTILLIIHLVVSLFAVVLKAVGKLRCCGAILCMSILIPIFGPICLADAVFRGTKEPDGEVSLALEQKKLEDEIFQSIPAAPDVDAKRIVPVSESLVLNSPLQRRQLLLILNRMPDAFVPQLRQAGRNEDTEVVHYAVTALMELRNDFSNQLTERDRALRAAPESVERMEAYAQTEERYLESGLPEGGERTERLRHYQTLLQELQERAEQDADANPGKVQTLMEKRVKTAMRLRSFGEAERLIHRMIQMFPDEESGYLLQVDNCAARRDRVGVDVAIRQMKKRGIALSATGESAVRFWSGQLL